MKKPKRRSFEADQGYSWISDLLGMTWTPPILKRVSITVLGASLGVIGLMILGTSYTLFKSEVLRLISYLFLAGAVFGTLLAGESGKRFFHFLVPVTTLRKIGIPAAEKPVSRTIVRIWNYGLLAVEISIWLWWKVFTAPPQPSEAEIGDRLIWLLSLRIQVADQFSLYWWLLPVLVISMFSILWHLDWFPVVGWLLRLTRIVPIFIIPPVAVLEALMIYRWWDITFQPLYP